MLRRKTIFWAASALVLCAAAVGVFFGFGKTSDSCLASAGPAPGWVKKDLAGFSDGFDYVHPRWNFGDTERSGYHMLVSAGGARAAEIGIEPVDQYGDSDCSLEETRLLRRAGVLTMRVRHSESMEDFSGGTLGFGLWNNKDGYHWDAVWFAACSKASSPRVYGLSVMVLDNSRIVFKKPVLVDISQWHDYSISVTSVEVAFSVDGRVVARARGLDAASACKGIVAWVDNKAVDVYENSHKIEYIPVPRKTFMLVDSVSWRPFD